MADLTPEQQATDLIAQITARTIRTHTVHETQFRVMGEAGRVELCQRLNEAFEGTDAPCCVLVVGPPDAADLWNGGYVQDDSGHRTALKAPRNIVLCPGVETSYKGSKRTVGRSFSKLRPAKEIADYIYESKQPQEFWEKKNRVTGKVFGVRDKEQPTDLYKPISNHPIGILVLIAQDGNKEFLSVVERIPDLVIYHMDAADFVAEEEGIEPISDVAVFKDAGLLSYPADVWNGTIYGDFADCCTQDNKIPKEAFIESLKTVVGAIVGDRLQSDGQKVHPRQYTLLVAPVGAGKDTAIDAAMSLCTPVEFDQDGTQFGEFITNSVPTFQYIGARRCNAASENAVIEHAGKWQSLLSTPPEFASFLDKSQIAGNKALLDIYLGAWESTSPTFSTAKGRKDVPGRVLLSLLTSIQPERLSTMEVSSGLASRITWVSLPTFEAVAYLGEFNFGDLQQVLFHKLTELEQRPLKIKTSKAAKETLTKWYRSLPLRGYQDDTLSVRMNVIVQKNALHLAWLSGAKEIDSSLIYKAIRLGDWQLSVRNELFIHETQNALACHQAKIMKALRKGPLTGRQITKATHAYEVGTEIHERSLKGLLSLGDIKTRVTHRKNSQEYYIPNEAQ